MRGLNAASGEALYSLLEEYPQALQGADRFPTQEHLKAHAQKIMGEMAPLLPPEMSQPIQREASSFKFGTAIPGADATGQD